MFRRFVGKTLTKLAVGAVAWLLFQGAAFAQTGCATCGSGGTAPCTTGTCSSGMCLPFCCPPALKWCMEGAPRICFKCGCPKPICCPADQPNWGYFQKCWSPWPFPPDWSHCPVQTPASTVYPGMIPNTQTSVPIDVGPTPRTLPARPPL